MAYFRQQIDIERPQAFVWDALRDVGALHTRLVRGFVLECEFDGQVRKLKFANGLSAAERIINVSESDRRVSWTASSERLEHHNASAQIFFKGSDSCTVVWIVDLLPDAMAPAIATMVSAGLAAMKATLESSSGDA
jgi:Polyketide cyclase / dehydrase and lipid transport